MYLSDIEDITDERLNPDDPSQAWYEASAFASRVYGDGASGRSALSIPGLWELIDDNDASAPAPEMAAPLLENAEYNTITGNEWGASRRLLQAGEGDGTSGDQPPLPPVSRLRTGRRARLQATAFFLTYSQSKLTKDQVTAWYIRQPRVKRCIVAEEHHQDGNIHFHAFVEYESRKDVTPKYFDILQEHPNVLIWTNREQTYQEWMNNHWKYCLKEDPECFIIGNPPDIDKKRKRDEVAREAVKRARATGVQAGLEYLEEYSCWELMTKYQSIVFALYRERNKAVTPAVSARSLDSFTNRPLIADSWRNLYISGPTGCGKTAYARALLPEATVVSHRDQLRDVDFSKGIIFDDFDVGHWPATAVIHLLDWEEPRGLDVKHGHVVIPAYTRKIFTHNNRFEEWIPQEKISSEQSAAMRRRVDVVNIHTKLF